MKKLRVVIGVICIVVLGLGITIRVAWGDESLGAYLKSTKKTQKEKMCPESKISATRDAWIKAGAKAGWMSHGNFRMGEAGAKEGEIQAFLCEKTTWQAIVLGKLPAPEQGFGLFLEYRVETELKHLAQFRSLLSLDL